MASRTSRNSSTTSISMRHAAGIVQCQRGRGRNSLQYVSAVDHLNEGFDLDVRKIAILRIDQREHFSSVWRHADRLSWRRSDQEGGDALGVMPRASSKPSSCRSARRCRSRSRHRSRCRSRGLSGFWRPFLLIEKKRSLSWAKTDANTFSGAMPLLCTRSRMLIIQPKTGVPGSTMSMTARSDP